MSLFNIPGAPPSGGQQAQQAPQAAAPQGPQGGVVQPLPTGTAGGAQMVDINSMPNLPPPPSSFMARQQQLAPQNPFAIPGQQQGQQQPFQVPGQQQGQQGQQQAPGGQQQQPGGNPVAGIVAQFLPGAQQQPGQQQGQQGQQQGQVDFGKDFAGKLFTPEALAAVSPGNRPNFQNLRAWAEAAANENQTLKQQMEESKKAGGDPKMMEEYQLLKSRQELLGNGAFIEEQRGVHESFKQIASGLKVSDAIVAQTLACENIGELLNLSKTVSNDADTRSLFMQEARKVLDANSKFQKAFKAPGDFLKEYGDKAALMKAEQGKQTAQQMAAHHDAAMQKVMADPKQAWLFGLPFFQQKFAQVKESYSGNAFVPVETVVQDRMLGAAVPDLLQMIHTMGAQLAQLSGQNRNLMQGGPYGGSSQPSAPAFNPGGAGAGSLISMPGMQSGPVFPTMGSVQQQPGFQQPPGQVARW